MMLFAALGMIPLLGVASNRQDSLQIRIAILPAAELTTLPPAVQRLDARMPGYGDRWAHARTLAADDPLQAVRALREAHLHARRHHDDARHWHDDMTAAGQALVADHLQDASPAREADPDHIADDTLPHSVLDA